jgi:hypothetical protein
MKRVRGGNGQLRETLPRAGMNCTEIVQWFAPLIWAFA